MSGRRAASPRKLSSGEFSAPNAPAHLLGPGGVRIFGLKGGHIAKLVIEMHVNVRILIRRQVTLL